MPGWQIACNTYSNRIGLSHGIYSNLSRDVTAPTARLGGFAVTLLRVTAGSNGSNGLIPWGLIKRRTRAHVKECAEDRLQRVPVHQKPTRSYHGHLVWATSRPRHDNSSSATVSPVTRPQTCALVLAPKGDTQQGSHQKSLHGY